MNSNLFIVVPIYMAEQYLDTCLRSLSSQTYKDMRIVLVDDGSKDKSGEIADSYCSSARNFYVIHQENKGSADARNAGIEYILSTFEDDIIRDSYIGFVDSDDWVSTDTYRIMMEAAISKKVDMVVCGRVDVYGSKKIVDDRLTPKKSTVISSRAAIKQILSIGGIDTSACDKIYRLSLMREIRFPSGEKNEDALFMFSFLISCQKVALVPESLYYYRHHENSVTTSFGADIRCLLNHAFNLKDLLVKNNTYYLKYCNMYIATMALYELLILYKLDNNDLETKLEIKRALLELRRNFISILQTGLSKKTKISAILVLLRLYKPIYSLYKWISGLSLFIVGNR